MTDTAERVLGVLRRRGVSLYVWEIAREAGVRIGEAHRAVLELERAGMVRPVVVALTERGRGE